ncbi:hypothetical protein MASR2M117_08850 [Paludibacter sp.]
MLSAQDNKLNISGYVRNYTGLLTKDMDKFSIVQNTLNMNFELKGEKTALKANPYIYQYFDKAPELGLREIYLDYYSDKFDVRVGKQQIIWGKAEGVFITDIISPKDLSEFLLRDFEEIRSGVTSVKLNYHSGIHTVEGVWVPVFTPTTMPPSNSIWSPKLSFPIVPIWDYSTSQKEFSVTNSEAFLRYSLLSSAFDMELVGGTFLYDDPAMHLTRQINPATMQLQSLTIRPDYHRVNMAGGSFSLPLGDFVIRGEGAYYDGRYFQTTATTPPDATIKKNYLHYMAGVDYTLAGIKLSTQFIQERILNYELGMQNEEVETTMTFLAKKDFFRERLWLELFAYVGINNKDALIRPKLTYSIADGMELQAGANIFTGTTGRFGQYNSNDMIYTKLKYSF